ncbi:MAG TPA: M14 family zinc carboxypeptidase [Planctomycetaceae bacterium]|nr:M14 family zinc carboxypeptidase [Planctomycetaceae bacterium]
MAFLQRVRESAGRAVLVFTVTIMSLGLSTDLAAQSVPASPVEFIDTGFENASPLWYETAADGSVQVYLLYDHERSSPNRAAGHIHFRVQAPRGTKLTLEFRNLDNVWNSQPGSVARELKAVVVSEDGQQWRSVATESPAEGRVRLPIEMPGPTLYVARVEPYRLSDLDRLYETIAKHRDVEVTPIGKTVEGRPLEIVRVGDPDAPHRVFVRARAHPWESGGNWVVQGLIQRLLQSDAEAEKYRRDYCLYVLPMANKDGVARGRTRFNLRGKDLNRNWDQPADPELAPENHALEKWLEALIAKGRRPHLALELHNDGSGLLHISRPPVTDIERHLARMATFEQLLRKHTWFTEGSTKPTFRNSGTLGDGWLQRYGIDAAVHEFNCNWIAGRQRAPLGKDWEEYGAGLAKAFDEYFGEVQP